MAKRERLSLKKPVEASEVLAEDEPKKKNVKVTLVHPEGTDTMKRLATRVIDGNLLKASTPEGRHEEAKAIYMRMMGIKATPHPFEVHDTVEPPFEAPPLPESSAAKMQAAMEDRVLDRLTDRLASGVSEGIAKAMKGN